MPILDQGYQHWSGTLSGHTWRWLAITRHGVRTSLRNKILRLTLLATMLPALALAAVLCVWGLIERQSELVATIRAMGIFNAQMLADPLTYRVDVWTLSYNYFLGAQTWASMIIVLIAGPSLISQDLRFNALPLYLSRPLRRFDYFLGKLGVIVTLIGATTVAPAVIAYLLGLLFSLDLSILRDTMPVLLGGVAYGLVVAVSSGLIMLALSALSRNSRYIALFWLAFWIGTGTVAGVLQGVDAEQRRHEAWNDEGGFDAEKFAAAELKASERTWRPLASYQANLTRLRQAMLGTDAVWDKLSTLQPMGERNMFLLQLRGPQFPWQWSAGVLAVLGVISAWILHRSIRSLDRVK
jgi:ABC-2 type transport system permease protein